MKYEEFDQQIREMIPQPSAAITDALYRMGVEALEDRPQDLLIAFEFISRYFSVDVLQGVYEIIQHGSAVLPNELVAAAVFLQAGQLFHYKIREVYAKGYPGSGQEICQAARSLCHRST